MINKNMISIGLFLLLWQFEIILGKPGVVDSPEIRKRAISTKLSTYNTIGPKNGNEEKFIPEEIGTPKLITDFEPLQSSDFEPMKITHEDFVTGGNTIYGTHSPFTNGGIIFAIGQGVPSTPLMSAAHPQPVLLQYLSPEGTPKQTAVQYVQLLRPLMVVPTEHYLTSQSVSMDVQTESTPITAKPTPNSYTSYLEASNTIIGAHSAPLTSYAPTKSLIIRSESDISLNMHEYVPAASSRVSTTSALSPQVTSMTGFRPSKFSMIAQRA